MTHRNMADYFAGVPRYTEPVQVSSDPKPAMLERRARINREKAEQIAADTLSGTFAGRQALGGRAITLDGVREMLIAAALTGLADGS